jgi:hypothetical protein
MVARLNTSATTNETRGSSPLRREEANITGIDVRILLGVALPSAISESYTSCWLFFFVLIACIAFILLLCTVGGVYCCCRRKTPITPK